MEWKARGRKRSPYLNPGSPWLRLITTWYRASRCTVCLINLYLISINSAIVMSIVMKHNLIVRKLNESFVSVTVYCLSSETVKTLTNRSCFLFIVPIFLTFLSFTTLLISFCCCFFNVPLFLLLWLSFLLRYFLPSNFFRCYLLSSCVCLSVSFIRDLHRLL